MSPPRTGVTIIKSRQLFDRFGTALGRDLKDMEKCPANSVFREFPAVRGSTNKLRFLLELMIEKTLLRSVLTVNLSSKNAAYL